MKLKCNIQAILVDTTMQGFFSIVGLSSWHMCDINYLCGLIHFNTTWIWYLYHRLIGLHKKTKVIQREKVLDFERFPQRRYCAHLQQVDEVIHVQLLSLRFAITKFNKDFVQYYTRFWKLEGVHLLNLHIVRGGNLE